MKQIVCEMCGGNELLKKDGFYCCIACGTKYTIEEARQLFVEGKVEVSGTISIDNSEEYANYKYLAQRARQTNDIENAKIWYNKYLVKYPNDWESYFYSSFLGLMSRNTFDADTVTSLYNLIQTTFQLITQDPNANSSSYIDICKFVTQRNYAAEGFNEFSTSTEANKQLVYNYFCQKRTFYMQINLTLINGVLYYFNDYAYANYLLIQLSYSLKLYKSDSSRNLWLTELNKIRDKIINSNLIPPTDVPIINLGFPSAAQILVPIAITFSILFIIFIILRLYH